jgi:opacity protein-like surface antigen
MDNEAMPRVVRLILTALLLVFVLAGIARADATGFVGTDTDPSNRPLFGFAVGAGLLILGFEFEYMSVNEDLAEAAPSLRTGMGNVYVQNPIPIAGLQFYGTIGAGVYHEHFDVLDESETNVGSNIGGGVKISLAGPLKLRLDYRVFTLVGGARYGNPQRIYAGLTLAF